MIKYSLKHALAAASFGLAAGAHAEANALPPVPEHKACAQLQQMPIAIDPSDMQAAWHEIRILIDECYKYGAPDAQHKAEDWMAGPYISSESSSLSENIARQDFKIAVLAKAAWQAWPEDRRYRLLNAAADLLTAVPPNQLDLFSGRAEHILNLSFKDSYRYGNQNHWFAYETGAPNVIEKIIALATQDVEKHYDFSISTYTTALLRTRINTDDIRFNQLSDGLIGWAQSWKDVRPEKSLDALSYFSFNGRDGMPADRSDNVRTGFKDLVQVFEDRHDYDHALNTLIQLAEFDYQVDGISADVETFIAEKLPSVFDRHPVNDDFIDTLRQLTNPDNSFDLIMTLATQKLEALEGKKPPMPQP